MSLNQRSFRQPDWVAFALWVLTTSLSSIVGMVVGAVFALFFAYRLGDWMAAVTLGLTFGLVIGAGQTWVLGKWVAQPMSWIMATAVGGVVDAAGLIVATPWNSPETTCVTAVVTGAVLGMAQWLVLRRWVKQAAWWVLATVTGRICGITLLLVMGDRSWLNVTLAVHLPMAVTTAAALVVLFRNTEKLFPANLALRPLGL